MKNMIEIEFSYQCQVFAVEGYAKSIHQTDGAHIIVDDRMVIAVQATDERDNDWDEAVTKLAQDVASENLGQDVWLQFDPGLDQCKEIKIEL